MAAAIGVMAVPIGGSSSWRLVAGGSSLTGVSRQLRVHTRVGDYTLGGGGLADAIVNAANSQLALLHQAGTAGAIASQIRHVSADREPPFVDAPEALQRDAQRLLQESAHGQLLQSCTLVPGHALAQSLPRGLLFPRAPSVSSIIHAVGPNLARGDQIQLVATAVQSALEAASAHRVMHLALPFLGAGVFAGSTSGAPSAHVQLLLRGLTDYLASSDAASSLEDVTVVDTSAPRVLAFVQLLAREAATCKPSNVDAAGAITITEIKTDSSGSSPPKAKPPRLASSSRSAAARAHALLHTRPCIR